MTCKTSAVAVCCSNASRVSLISRAFSIAITACAAKFCNSAICLRGKRSHFLAVEHDETKDRLVLAQRYDHEGAGTAEIDDGTPIGLTVSVRVGIHEVENVNDALPLKNARRAGSRPIDWNVLCHELRIGRRHASYRRESETSVFVCAQFAETGLAQPHRLFEHRVKHRPKIAG